MTRSVRFLRVELAWGCHARAFELADRGEPIVIAGPNGAGKSTVLEGLVRTLFGFNRRTPNDSHELEWRKPWSGAPGRGRVELCDTSGLLAVVEREFDSNDVTLRTAAGATDVWRGDGNPAATSASASDFRQRLRALVGFERLETYEQTAYVRQGGLLETKVGQNLLRAAAGSPIDVERALDAIEQAHRRLSQEPVGPGRTRANKPRERESLLRQIADLEQKLEAARAAERARGPLLAEQERGQRALELLTRTLDALESAQLVLVRRDALRAEITSLEERIAARERQAEEVTEARAEVAAARARGTELGPDQGFPEDFAERAAALEQLWGNRARVEPRCASARRATDEVRLPGLGWTILACVVTAAASIAWGISRDPIAAAGAAIGVAGLVTALYVRRWARARHAEQAQAQAAVERELEEIDREIGRVLDPIPAGNGLTAATLGEHRAQFLRRRASDAGYRHSAEALEGTLRRAAAAVGLATARARDLEAVLDELQRSVTNDRNARAEKRLRLDEASRVAYTLPEAVRDDVDDVQRALAARRAERTGLEQQLRTVAERLAEQRISRGPVAIEDELMAQRERLVETDEAAEASRSAYQLLDEAHREFRDEDQRRLVDHISAHLHNLSGGALGPLEAPGELDAARLHAFGRQVPLDYRPLSYGQLHLVLLAVRLGAADFLARWGIAVPLIVDEPFASLDDDNAAAVWDQLRTVARGRQVIVATQESSLMGRLGVRPDVTLVTQTESPVDSPPRLQ